MQLLTNMNDLVGRSLVTCSVCAVIVLAAFFVYSSPSSAAYDPRAPWREQVSHWEQAIRERGGTAAYEDFAGVVAELPYAEKHVKAHAFGAGLFAALGAEGVSVCDARFSFGCFHQFLGDAIAAIGLESIPSLNERCFDALSQSPLSCQHGIGHGTLAAIGYDERALDEALRICRDLPGADPIGGCYGGVFMEYNVRTMLAEEATTRDFTGNYFAPCDALESEYVAACIYWQPQWWLNVITTRDSPDATFATMGDLCREFSTDADINRQCFEGIGNIVAQTSGFDPGKARVLCDNAAIFDLRSRTSDRERVLCRAIGANHFGIDVGADAARAVCEGLTGNAETFCLAYAANTGNVANELPLDF